jgi:hypothetical protein
LEGGVASGVVSALGEKLTLERYTFRMIPMLFMVSAASGIATHRRECLAAERGSQGVILCSPKNVSFTLVGRTTGNGYSIYNYHYRFLPHAGGVMHGGQRLVVFQGERYVGQYALQPEVTVAVSGSRVLLRGDEDAKAVRLDFTGKPPHRILVNGELSSADLTRLYPARGMAAMGGKRTRENAQTYLNEVGIVTFTNPPRRTQ